LKPDECEARARAIEQRANDLADAARKNFQIWHPVHRSARYANGIGDVIRELAVAETIERIEKNMLAEMNALYEEFYAPENYDDRNAF
jgi:hypothetical protein